MFNEKDALKMLKIIGIVDGLRENLNSAWNYTSYAFTENMAAGLLEEIKDEEEIQKIKEEFEAMLDLVRKEV